MKQNKTKILLAICVSILFCGCFIDNIRDNILVGAKFRTTNPVTNNKYIYIYFQDETTAKCCFVDFNLRKLEPIHTVSYITTDKPRGSRHIEFFANDRSLQSAIFFSSNINRRKSLNLTIDSLAYDCQIVDKFAN